MNVERYETREYRVEAAGRAIRILGPEQADRLLDDPIVAQRFAADEYLPYWAQPWPAAVMLADEAQRHLPPGLGPILEIGAGLGIASIALATAGHRVIATDYDEDALAFIRANARLNDVELYDVRFCDWRHPPLETFSAIIGSDVLYEARHLEPVAHFLSAGLQAGGQAIISTPVRAAAEAFPALVEEAGLQVDVISTEARSIAACDESSARVIQGRVYVVQRPR